MTNSLDESLSQDSIDSEVAKIRWELKDEYLQEHNKDWIIGFSGGKDSTLVVHLVFEMLLELSPELRTRKVHIVANDTLVESPMVVGHLKKVMAQLDKAKTAFNLPVTVVMTHPAVEDTFWVNLIGRGYPSPNRSFRWCTDRMKIKPTSDYIRRAASASGEVIMLLGVRRTESSARAGVVAKYDNGERLHKHSELTNCYVFRPIVELDTDDVWEFLGGHNPPWGGAHTELIKLYRDAQGGECPIVIQKSDAPSCGTSSSRFGCWTCTVVAKDKSLAGFVDAGFDEYIPLIEFRDWLTEIRNDPNMRSAIRRTGKITIAVNGKFIPGPFTLEARKQILDKLINLQDKVGHELISEAELSKIREMWSDEVMASSGRAVEIQFLGEVSK